MAYGYRYRGYGRRSRNDGEDKRSRITHLDKLSIQDLKKLIKSLKNKETKKIETEQKNKILQDKRAPLSAKLDKINDQKKILKEEFEELSKPSLGRLSSSYDHLIKNYEPGLLNALSAKKKINASGWEITILLEDYHNGVASNFINAGEEYDAHKKRYKEKLHLLTNEASDINKQIRSIEPITNFRYSNPSLSINGHRMIFDTDKWTIDEIQKVLNEKIELEKKQKQEEQDKLNSLKSRAAKNESEVRSQVDKYRYLKEEQLARWNGCPYCFKVMNPSDMQIDHIYPVSKGGKTSKENLVCVCSKFNNSCRF